MKTKEQYNSSYKILMFGWIGIISTIIIMSIIKNIA